MILFELACMSLILYCALISNSIYLFKIYYYFPSLLFILS